MCTKSSWQTLILRKGRFVPKVQCIKYQTTRRHRLRGNCLYITTKKSFDHVLLMSHLFSWLCAICSRQEVTHSVSVTSLTSWSRPSPHRTQASKSNGDSGRKFEVLTAVLLKAQGIWCVASWLWLNMAGRAFMFRVKWPKVCVYSTMLRNVGSCPSVDTDLRQKLLDFILRPIFQSIKPMTSS
jgi:hypothetical protein